MAALPEAGVVILSEGDRSDPQNLPPPIQGFDVHGNPANLFKNQSSAYVDLRQETGPVTYLHAVVESRGHIYLLKYLNDGENASDYVVDIYSPDGSYLTQISGIAAASIAISYWRALFALNYEIIAKPSDSGTEPAVSMWLPSTPTG